MGRQRKNPQSKGMEDHPLKDLNETEANKLSDTQIKRMVKRMLKEVTDDYNEQIRNYNTIRRELETINKNQEEMNNTISEIKNIL